MRKQYFLNPYWHEPAIWIKVSSFVLRMEQLLLPPMGDRSVRVHMLAAPVNPADMNMIQGKVTTHTASCLFASFQSRDGQIWCYFIEILVFEVKDAEHGELTVANHWSCLHRFVRDLVPPPSGGGEWGGGRSDRGGQWCHISQTRWLGRAHWCRLW